MSLGSSDRSNKMSITRQAGPVDPSVRAAVLAVVAMLMDERSGEVPSEDRRAGSQWPKASAWRWR